MGRGSLRLGLSPKERFLVLPYITCNISDFDILSRVYLLPFIGSKWFSEFSETYLCLRGKGKPSFILLRSANKEKSIQILFNIVMEKIKTVLQMKRKRQRLSKILNLNIDDMIETTTNSKFQILKAHSTVLGNLESEMPC